MISPKSISFKTIHLFYLTLHFKKLFLSKILVNKVMYVLNYITLKMLFNKLTSNHTFLFPKYFVKIQFLKFKKIINII